MNVDGYWYLEGVTSTEFEADPFVDGTLSARWWAVIAGTTLTLYENTGHGVMQSNEVISTKNYNAHLAASLMLGGSESIRPKLIVDGDTMIAKQSSTEMHYKRSTKTLFDKWYSLKK